MRALLVLCLVGLSACGGGGGGGTSPAPTVPAPTGNLVPPAGSIYLGAFVNTGSTQTSLTAQLAALEQKVGHKMVLSMHYRSWTTVFPTTEEADDAQHGRIPVISWNCAVPDVQVAAGLQDANIGSHADAIKAYGRPVFLRFMWEMNNPGGVLTRENCYDPATDEPNGVFSATQFIAAWQHIRAVFAAHNVTNVVWLWNPSGDSVNPPGRYYPGDTQVDWVGIDEYDRTDVSFAQTFAIYGPLAAFNKPILIAETGAHPETQVAFLGAAAALLRTQFPLVKAFMYFDADGQYDWRLTAAGTAAFAAMAADPYLSAQAP